jgi:Domain of unknown function (DUF4386)
MIAAPARSASSWVATYPPRRPQSHGAMCPARSLFCMKPRSSCVSKTSSSGWLRLPPRRCLHCCAKGRFAAAAHLAETHELPLGLARIDLATGDTPAALDVLEPWRQQVEAKGWADERLKVMILQAVALVIGAFLMLLNTVLDVGKGVLFFPILETHGKRSALAYLGFIIVQVVFLDIGVLALLLIVPWASKLVTPGRRARPGPRASGLS